MKHGKRENEYMSKYTYINNPIFFVGQGRSGTTIAFEHFVNHGDIAYMSNYTDKLKSPVFGIFHLLFGIRGKKNQYNDVSKINRLLPKTSESHSTWNRLCGDKFSNTFLKGVKATEAEAEKIKSYVQQIISFQKKCRFSTKLTGPPRIEYLASIFKEAYFINIIRDPRAVVASLKNVEFWINSPNKPFWKDAFSEHHYELWNTYNKCDTSLAALECLAIFEQTKKEAEHAKVLNIKYECFADEPISQLTKIYKFTNLNLSDANFIYTNNNMPSNMNYKYKDRLSKEEIKIVENICAPIIDEYGYE